MKPYGRIKNLKGLPYKQDVHPAKGYVNWWELICKPVTRSTLKRKWKRDINNDINDNL